MRILPSLGPLALTLLTTVMNAPVAGGAVVAGSPYLGLTIPDDSNAGLALSLDIVESVPIQDLEITLDLAVPVGGSVWMGDLYAYLLHDSGFSVLLNRPGRRADDVAGYDDSVALQVTFDDDAPDGDIHTYRLALLGNESLPLASDLVGFWQPDGRAVDPAVVLASDPRSALFDSFLGLDSAGTWNLFLADLSGGGEFQIRSWNIQINDTVAAVPEPSQAGAVAFMAIAGGCLVARRRRRATAA